jgi:hypothetical protein
VPSACWYFLLADEVRDRFGSDALSVAIGLNVTVSVVLLLMTMLTEPGILPTITYEEYAEGNPDVPVRIVSRVLLDGREYELRQFRAKFSRYTANCIESFDHYCPWVGNAVGKRNYRYFVLFMCSSLLLACTVSGGCTALLIVKSVRDHQSFLAVMEKSVTATVMAIYGYCMMFSLVGLCGFHARAIASNMTTNEILKGVYGQGNLNPHDQGCSRNCWTFLCSPVPMSRVAEVDSEGRGARLDADSADEDAILQRNDLLLPLRNESNGVNGVNNETLDGQALDV